MASYAEAMPDNPEVERCFDPRHVTIFGTRETVLNDKRIEIHATNSFFNVVEAVVSHQIGEEPKTLSEIAYRERVASEPVLQDAVLGFLATEVPVSDAIRGILEVRKSEDLPVLYVVEDPFQADPNSPDLDSAHEEDELRGYYSSLAFDEIAARARVLDPNYELEKFVT